MGLIVVKVELLSITRKIPNLTLQMVFSLLLTDHCSLLKGCSGLHEAFVLEAALENGLLQLQLCGTCSHMIFTGSMQEHRKSHPTARRSGGHTRAYLILTRHPQLLVWECAFNYSYCHMLVNTGVSSEILWYATFDIHVIVSSSLA